MIRMGLDGSTKCSGWCIFDDDKLLYHGKIIADKNLEILFNITTKNNNGPDKDFMDILQKYIFGEVFTIGDLDIKTR